MLAIDDRGWKSDSRAILQALFILFLVESAIPACIYCGEIDNDHPLTQSRSASGAQYEGVAFIENAAFLGDTAYMSEWMALSDQLLHLTPDSLSQCDPIVLLYVRDLRDVGFDSYMNLQQVAICCPDTFAFAINYGSAVRAYERSVQLAPLVVDPTLQRLTHDLRQKLRILALKIEKLMFGQIPPGQQEPALLLWKYGSDSSATLEK